MNKQITEDYVSYEIAVLLKEKGFDIPVKNYFSLNKDAMLHNLDKKYGAKKNWNHFEYCISRPSQSIALKLLREVHKLFVNLDLGIANGDKGALLSIVRYNNNDIEFLSDYTFEDSYEQAVEAALKYTLENLI